MAVAEGRAPGTSRSWATSTSPGALAKAAEGEAVMQRVRCPTALTRAEKTLLVLYAQTGLLVALGRPGRPWFPRRVPSNCEIRARQALNDPQRARDLAIGLRPPPRSTSAGWGPRPRLAPAACRPGKTSPGRAEPARRRDRPPPPGPALILRLSCFRPQRKKFPNAVARNADLPAHSSSASGSRRDLASEFDQDLAAALAVSLPAIAKRGDRLRAVVAGDRVGTGVGGGSGYSVGIRNGVRTHYGRPAQ